MPLQKKHKTWQLKRQKCDFRFLVQKNSFLMILQKLAVYQSWHRDRGNLSTSLQEFETLTLFVGEFLALITTW